MALNDTGGYTIAPDAGPLPKVQPGTPGIPGQAPLGATPYNPNDSSTWTTGVARPGDSFNMSQSDRNAAVTWGQGQSGVRPWENRSASANDTRNNFYYGGTPGGAAAFNGQVYQTGQDLGMGFGRVENNAGFLQKNALANQSDAQSRSPGRFLDQYSSTNNALDRGYQLGAMNGLQNYIAQGPGPSAAQAQLNLATNQNTDSALALARSGRGMGGGAAAMRQAVAQNAVTQQNAANQSAVLRAQENQNWQQNQLNAYNQLGGISGNARMGDVQQASYTSGTQQAASNANDQTALGYGAQSLGAGNLALGANQGNTSAQLGFAGLQNDVNKSALQGNENYEQNLYNLYAHNTFGAQAPQGTNYSPYFAAAGAVIGTAVGGPGGGVAGYEGGSALGSAVS